MMIRLILMIPLVFVIACGTTDTTKEERMARNQTTGPAIDGNPQTRVIFASFAQSNGSLRNTMILAKSIRRFGGSMRDQPIVIYIPHEWDDPNQKYLDGLRALNVDIRRSKAPESSLWFYYARKVYAAAQAEREAEGRSSILVWMDEDTIFLKNPSDLVLEHDIVFGYRPVMHNRSGSALSEAPDEFWSRVYEVLSVPDSLFFPMVTVADKVTIRPYFNAGLLAVRPEKAILRRWVDDFEKLYTDSTLAEMCRNDVEKRIFIHQAALVAGPLHLLKHDEMIELPDTYNYPLFFKEMFGAPEEFDSIENVVTLRHESYFRNPSPDWAERLKGSPEVISWLKENLVTESE